MVNLTTTRTFRYTRQATVSWITRACKVALDRRAASATPESKFVLDTLLQRDEEHPNWWVSPTEEGVGPLARRELAENQPRWLNAANKAGFFSGVKAWNWSRCGLGDSLPGHYVTVRYELDRENGNQYVNTVLEVHEGVEPAEVIHPHPQRDETRPYGRGVARQNGRGDEARSYETRGPGQGRGRGRGGTYRPDQRASLVAVDTSNTWAGKLRTNQTD